VTRCIQDCTSAFLTSGLCSLSTLFTRECERACVRSVGNTRDVSVHRRAALPAEEGLHQEVGPLGLGAQEVLHVVHAIVHQAPPAVPRHYAHVRVRVIEGRL
jgi:hypothetical protein